MRTLFLSNNLNPERLDAVASRWDESHPSPADFQCVIIDMKLKEGQRPGVYHTAYNGFPFYSLFDDILRLLSAGGVVMCLNYYTSINDACSYRSGGLATYEEIWKQRRGPFTYEYKYTGEYETSYDWLDLGFLQQTQIDSVNARPGRAFRVVSNIAPLSRYFEYIAEYHKTIKGIDYDPDTWEGTTEWWWVHVEPGAVSSGYTCEQTWILAVTEVTNEPIALAMKYIGLAGTLVILPTYEISGTSDVARADSINCISSALIDLGEHYYKINREELGIRLETPPWLLDYRAKPAREAEERLAELEREKDSLISERDKYDRMLHLINGYGNPLERTVEELFGKEWLGFDVEKPQTNYPIDLFVNSPTTGQTLAIQVTGLAGKLTQSDRHFGALMNYLPEHEEKNLGGRNERIVLTVNTFRDTPLSERITDDISVPVKNLLERNKICLIRSSDLYGLWNAWLDAPMSKDDIFRQLFECEGIWEREQTSGT